MAEQQQAHEHVHQQVPYVYLRRSNLASACAQGGAREHRHGHQKRPDQHHLQHQLVAYGRPIVAKFIGPFALQQGVVCFQFQQIAVHLMRQHPHQHHDDAGSQVFAIEKVQHEILLPELDIHQELPEPVHGVEQQLQQDEDRHQFRAAIGEPCAAGERHPARGTHRVERLERDDETHHQQVCLIPIGDERPDQARERSRHAHHHYAGDEIVKKHRRFAPHLQGFTLSKIRHLLPPHIQVLFTHELVNRDAKVLRAALDLLRLDHVPA